MAFAIETGTPLTGGNSYATAAELSTYLDDRGYTVTGDSEKLLVRAFDFMRGLPWTDSHIVAYTVTQAMKDAQCEIVYRMSLGSDPTAAATGRVKRSKVDSLEQEFFETYAPSGDMGFLRSMPVAYSLLASLITPSPKYFDRA